MTDRAPPAEPPDAATGAAAFVWAAWALAFASALAFVLSFGRNVPVWDEWILVPQLAGEARVSPRWLWQPHNEHRIPVPKLIYLALGRLTGGDCRAGMVFNVCTLAALALGLILAARKLRGAPAYADALLPLALLHVGHWANMLMGFQIQFVFATALAGGLLLLILLLPFVPMRRLALLAGPCLLLLSLCGANGLILVPPLAAWLGYLAWRCRGLGPEGRRDARALALAAAAALVLVGLYFVGFRAPDHTPRAADPLTPLVGGVQFLTVMVGHAGAVLWPYSGWAVAGLYLSGLALLARVLVRQPEERPRAGGLALFLVGLAGLALAVGLGRGELAPVACFSPRYVTLAAPALCALYFAYGLYLPRAVGSLAQLGMLTLAGLLLGLNVQNGLEGGREVLARTQPFQEELRAGMPLELLAIRHAPALFPYGETRVAVFHWLGMLRRAGVGPFRSPASRAVTPLPSPHGPSPD